LARPIRIPPPPPPSSGYPAMLNCIGTADAFTRCELTMNAQPNPPQQQQQPRNLLDLSTELFDSIIPLLTTTRWGGSQEDLSAHRNILLTCKRLRDIATQDMEKRPALFRDVVLSCRLQSHHWPPPNIPWIIPSPLPPGITPPSPEPEAEDRTVSGRGMD
jgi:hypothetical protein